MAPAATELTTKVQSGSPYQLDQSQILRASEALVKHIASEEQRSSGEAPKKNLLADDDASSDEAKGNDDTVPVWLIVTTKKHIVNKARLKPGKIPLPHPLNTDPGTRICLITADPQRTYKDIVAHPSFPSDLGPRIARVIGISKLRAKYKAYEARRQLASEHDVFLADDRIITSLPALLGKTFYQTGARRPVPVSLRGNEKTPRDAQGRKVRRPADAPPAGLVAGSPEAVAREIRRALEAALVHLSPSTSTAVKVGRADWAPEWIAANVEAVVAGLTANDKFIPRGWRNVKSLHIKGPNTMALPVWLADELWVDEEDVLDEAWKEDPEKVQQRLEKKKERKAKAKGRATEAGANEEKAERSEWKEKKEKKRKAEGETKDAKPAKKSKKDKSFEDDNLAKEIAKRKEKLKRQRAEAMEGDEDVVKMLGNNKKVKKAKSKA
ncbi:ribosomal protein L1p/L10e family-domain-containing protein [Lineolata rhizophorae]|uniref:Ribosomal protein L1p/L10e family-domain-containing protein n=1 Tax=Lineolata rhizophorae TaxID=578093 RepID=A0A6A6NXE3_9PEZI|nr:ribosomal protein L1p/L10e family-domain-containing protein [Lineolata rhizophorae]